MYVMFTNNGSRRWYRRQSRKLEPVLETGVMKQVNGILTFEEVKLQHEGSYICVAANELGEVRAETRFTVSGTCTRPTCFHCTIRNATSELEVKHHTHDLELFVHISPSLTLFFLSRTFFSYPLLCVR